MCEDVSLFISYHELTPIAEVEKTWTPLQFYLDEQHEYKATLFNKPRELKETHK